MNSIEFTTLGVRLLVAAVLNITYGCISVLRAQIHTNDIEGHSQVLSQLCVILLISMYLVLPNPKSTFCVSCLCFGCAVLVGATLTVYIQKHGVFETHDVIATTSLCSFVICSWIEVSLGKNSTKPAIKTKFRIKAILAAVETTLFMIYVVQSISEQQNGGLPKTIIGISLCVFFLIFTMIIANEEYIVQDYEWYESKAKQALTATFLSSIIILIGIHLITPTTSFTYGETYVAVNPGTSILALLTIWSTHSLFNAANIVIGNLVEMNDQTSKSALKSMVLISCCCLSFETCLVQSMRSITAVFGLTSVCLMSFGWYCSHVIRHIVNQSELSMGENFYTKDLLLKVLSPLCYLALRAVLQASRYKKDALEYYPSKIELLIVMMQFHWTTMLQWVVEYIFFQVLTSTALALV